MKKATANAIVLHKKPSPAKVIKTLLTHLMLIFSGGVIAMPFFWMITNSLKTKEEIWARPPVLFPEIAQWQNYTDALGDGLLMRYTFNSFFVATAVTIIVLFNSAMFAYALTHIRMRGRTVFFTKW